MHSKILKKMNMLFKFMFKILSANIILIGTDLLLIMTTFLSISVVKNRQCFQPIQDIIRRIVQAYNYNARLTKSFQQISILFLEDRRKILDIENKNLADMHCRILKSLCLLVIFPKIFSFQHRRNLISSRQLHIKIFHSPYKKL